VIDPGASEKNFKPSVTGFEFVTCGVAGTSDSAQNEVCAIAFAQTRDSNAKIVLKVLINQLPKTKLVVLTRPRTRPSGVSSAR
jgi:hypothetical protein